MPNLNYDVSGETITRLATLRLKTGRWQKTLLEDAVHLLYKNVADGTITYEYGQTNPARPPLLSKDSLDDIKTRVDELPRDLKPLGDMMVRLFEAIV